MDSMGHLYHGPLLAHVNRHNIHMCSTYRDHTRQLATISSRDRKFSLYTTTSFSPSISGESTCGPGTSTFLLVIFGCGFLAWRLWGFSSLSERFSFFNMRRKLRFPWSFFDRYSHKASLGISISFRTLFSLLECDDILIRRPKGL